MQDPQHTSTTATLCATGQGVGRTPFPVRWIRADSTGLTAVDERGIQRRWAVPADVDRVVITPAQPDKEVDTSAGPYSPPKPGYHRWGHATFFHGPEPVVNLPLTQWGPGQYAVVGPQWDQADPSTATGVRAAAEALGVPVEVRPDASSKQRRAGNPPVRYGGFATVASLGSLSVLAPVFGLVLLTMFASTWWEPMLRVSGALMTALTGWVAVVVLSMAWWGLLRWRARRRALKEGSPAINPSPAGRVPRGFPRTARVLEYQDRLEFYWADGRIQAVPPVGDANGPVAVEVRDLAKADDRKPYRVQFLDARDTVLAELGWEDWFGGDHGRETLRALCVRWGLRYDLDTVLPDDMPAGYAPLDGRQAGQSWFAGKSLGVMMLLYPVLWIVGAWRIETIGPFDAYVIPAWAAVVAWVLARPLPALVRRLWLARPRKASDSEHAMAG